MELVLEGFAPDTLPPGAGVGGVPSLHYEVGDNPGGRTVRMGLESKEQGYSGRRARLESKEQG